MSFCGFFLVDTILGLNGNIYFAPTSTDLSTFKIRSGFIESLIDGLVEKKAIVSAIHTQFKFGEFVSMHVYVFMPTLYERTWGDPDDVPRGGHDDDDDLRPHYHCHHF